MACAFRVHAGAASLTERAILSFSHTLLPCDVVACHCAQNLSTDDPWGQAQTGSAPTFGFTGELHDGAAGLVNLRARRKNHKPSAPVPNS
jgi:hypothetical protein